MEHFYKSIRLTVYFVATFFTAFFVTVCTVHNVAGRCPAIFFIVDLFKPVCVDACNQTNFNHVAIMSMHLLLTSPFYLVFAFLFV